MKKKIIFTFILGVILSGIYVGNVKAAETSALYEQPNALSSYGRFEYDENDDGIPEIVIDSQDLYYLYEICK